MAPNNKRPASSPPAAQTTSKQRKRERLRELRRISPTTAASSESPAVPSDAHLDVTDFVQAREKEINSMEMALRNSHSAVGKRIFQMLPRFLRRRATSHNVKRLPKVLRAIGASQADKMPSTDKQTRKRKRSKKQLLLAAKRRQLTKRWLETHIWHAKRMHMKTIWGHRLAERPTEKCRKRLYRASLHSMWIHDASYWQCFQLSGGDDQMMAAFLKPHLDPATNLIAERYTGGQFEGEIMLYKSYPSQALAPCRFHWQDHQLWLWIHPAASQHVLDVLEEAAQKYNAESEAQVKIAIVDLNRFELRGARCHALLNVLLSLKDPKSPSGQVWKTLAPLRLPASLPPGCVLSLDVWDPRLRFPVKMPKRPTDATEISEEIRQIMKQWPANVSTSRLYSAEARRHVIETKRPQSEIDQRRRKKLIPGTPLDPTPRDSIVPIMLVQNGNGWDLILPSEWASQFWLSFVYAGAKAAGLRDKSIVAFEECKLNFPSDALGTPAFLEHIQTEKQRLQEEYDRRPPSKRPNYKKLGFEHPFAPPFSTVDWQMNGSAEIQAYLREDMSEVDDTNAWIAVRLYLPNGVPVSVAQVRAIPATQLSQWTAVAEKKTNAVDEKLTAGDIVGYVTTGNYSLKRGHGFAVGFMQANYVKNLVRSSKSSAMVLVRNPSSIVPYPAYVEIILQ